MKQQILLSKFEYNIPASAIALASVKRNYPAAAHLPLMKVNIDFDKGLLKLEGDWQFMVKSNRHNDGSWAGSQRERVTIKMDIYSDVKINLADASCDGLVFPLEGTIKEGNTLSSCTGLLVIDNVRDTNGHIGCQWNISFYFYDLRSDDCEIKFNLPVYTRQEKSHLN